MCVTLSSCVLLHADLSCFGRTHFYTVRLVLFRKIGVKICPFVQRFKCLYDSCYIYFLAHAVLRIHFCKLQGISGSPLKAIFVMCVILRRCNELLENQLTFCNSLYYVHSKCWLLFYSFILSVLWMNGIILLNSKI